MRERRMSRIELISEIERLENRIDESYTLGWANGFSDGFEAALDRVKRYGTDKL